MSTSDLYNNSKELDLLSKSISSTNFTAAGGPGGGGGTLPMTTSTLFGKTLSSFRLNEVDGMIPHPPPPAV